MEQIPNTNDKIPLAGLLPDEIEKLLSPIKRYRAIQIFNWIIRGIESIDHMSDLPVSLRHELNKKYKLYSGTVINEKDDAFSKKIIIALNDGLKIESVLLSDDKARLTACLSTQVGCPVKCVFCKTGQMGFSRNLTAAEILEQFIFLSQSAFELPSKKKIKTEKSKKVNNSHLIENIVIMGMGEPLLNLENLRKAIAIFNGSSLMNFSKRRITISTCGICDGLFDLAENGPYVRLALSLITADEKLREKLMPAAAANPLQRVKEALILYQKKSGSRITFEIPLLGGINTREKDAVNLLKFTKGLEAVINIIPWNPVDGLEFDGKSLQEPEKNESENFINMLESRGLKVTVRRHKGRGVMGACGQLGDISG